MNPDAYRDLLALLQKLDHAKIHHTLSRPRAEAVMVDVHIPGERWEIELVDYGDECHWEIERFHSTGAIDDESALEELFRDPVEEPAAKP